MVKSVEDLIDTIEKKLGNTVDDLEGFLDMERNELFKPINGIGDTTETVINGTFKEIELVLKNLVNIFVEDVNKKVLFFDQEI